MSKVRTSDQILSLARDILETEGIGAVSFDAIARRLGRSKQAVLYWFPTKKDLLNAMFLSSLQAEAQAAQGAVAGASDQNDAIRSFVDAVSSFHFAGLDRYRMMYLLPQTLKQRTTHNEEEAPPLENIHQVTDQLYAALAHHLQGDPVARREKAVAIHSAVLGLVLMVALADSVRDPLKHSTENLVEALIQSFTTR